MNKQLLMTWRGRSNCGTNYAIEFWAGEVAEVSLLSYPTDAAEALARAVRGYTGNYSRAALTREEADKLYADLKATKLGTPAEMLNFVFLVNDVPRSWTHQAVRTRIGASVVQESTRFFGSRGVYRVLVPKTLHHATSNGEVVDETYADGTIVTIGNYADLVEQPGVSNQDARQILPHSLLTHMFWSLTLRALMGIYEVRWCCQAEPSTWIPVMKQMKKLIRESCGDAIAGFLIAPVDRGQNCGFGASFDRPCTWRPRPPESELV